MSQSETIKKITCVIGVRKTLVINDKSEIFKNFPDHFAFFVIMQSPETKYEFKMRRDGKALE